MGGLIHVGAWQGIEYVNHEGRLLLFEPQAGPFAVLQRNLGGRPDVVLVNAAAGAAVGNKEIYRVEPDHSSSLLEPINLRPGFRQDGMEPVRVTTIDAELTELTELTGTYDELVVDTQGYELEVLKGARETLKGITRVLCELHDPHTYPGAASLDDLDGYLVPLGFARTSFDTEASDDLGDAVYERSTDDFA